MEYRELGNTSLRASVIGMGCEGMTEDNYAMCGRLFDEAEKLGINYFDLYASDPELRSAVGQALKGRLEKSLIQSHICSICEPCPMYIDIASVTKFLHLAQAQGTIPETVREHYAALAHHAGECVQCGSCETWICSAGRSDLRPE